jgi:hypothetical protein
MNRSDIPIMLDGIRYCISTAFDHEAAFLRRFADNAKVLTSVRMGSVSTLFIVASSGQFERGVIPNDDFLEWVFEQRKAES